MAGALPPFAACAARSHVGVRAPAAGRRAHRGLGSHPARCRRPASRPARSCDGDPGGGRHRVRPTVCRRGTARGSNFWRPRTVRPVCRSVRPAEEHGGSPRGVRPRRRDTPLPSPRYRRRSREALLVPHARAGADPRAARAGCRDRPRGRSDAGGALRGRGVPPPCRASRGLRPDAARVPRRRDAGRGLSRRRRPGGRWRRRDPGRAERSRHPWRRPRRVSRGRGNAARPPLACASASRALLVGPGRRRHARRLSARRLAGTIRVPVARRIPLPRLTQRQRMARWQRERRQQTIIVTIFSAILFFTLGLVAWAASSRYYDNNLKPALMFDGHAVSMREYKRELAYQYVRFYVDFGVPPGYENDPQVLTQKAEYEGVALDALVEEAILDSAARADGIK